MGRRALRKVDAAPESTGHFRAADALSQPFDRFEVFQREAPLEIEIGSGKGLFLATAAETSPDHDFVGIEISRKYAFFAAARLAQAELRNAVMIHGRAEPVFQEGLTGNSIEAVHIYFPDPWWKKRHRKRRIMNEAFLTAVHRVLRPGGSLHFWTDVESYFHESLELISARIPLSEPLCVDESPAEHDLDYRTHFERRMRSHGMPVYRAEFRK